MAEVLREFEDGPSEVIGCSELAAGREAAQASWWDTSDDFWIGKGMRRGAGAIREVL